MLQTGMSAHAAPTGWQKGSGRRQAPEARCLASPREAWVRLFLIRAPPKLAEEAPVSVPGKVNPGILGPEAGSLGAWWAQMAPLGTVRESLLGF